MAVIEAIATTYLEADATSVTFSSISGSYQHLQLRMSLRSGDSGVAGYWGNIKIRFNDASAYTYHNALGGDPFGAGSETDQVVTYTGDTYMNSGFASTDLSEAANYASGILDILDYSDDGNKNTTMLLLAGHSGTNSSITFGSGLWDNTDDVTTVMILCSSGLWRGSEFSLYGLNSS